MSPENPMSLSASSSLRALVDSWRERARLARPLESAPLTRQKRERIKEWMFYTNRANELSAALDAHQEEENQSLPGTPGQANAGSLAPVAAWSPIGTAPKDGTWFIGHSGKWGRLPEVVQWSQYANCWQTMDRGVHPTHWMRLPPLSDVAQSAATTPEDQPVTPAFSPPEPPAWTIECPCCGDDAAFGGASDLVADGQALACGCTGHISVDSDGVQGVYTDDCLCEGTGASSPPEPQGWCSKHTFGSNVDPCPSCVKEAASSPPEWQADIYKEATPSHRICACNYAMIPKTLLVQHVCTKCGRIEVDDKRTIVVEPDDDLSKLASELAVALERSAPGMAYAAIYGALSAHVINRTIGRTLRGVDGGPLAQPEADKPANTDSLSPAPPASSPPEPPKCVHCAGPNPIVCNRCYGWVAYGPSSPPERSEGQRTVCVWTADDHPDWGGDLWDTSCGQTFQLAADTPTMNGFLFCTYCGGRLEEAPALPPEPSNG
jgi:hypothetical protein